MGVEGDRGRELLRVEEVARALGLSPATVYRWCQAGTLPALKAGKGWRIRRAALAAFLRRREGGARGQAMRETAGRATEGGGIADGAGG